MSATRKLLAEGLGDAVGFVVGALSGFGTALLLGMDLFAPGYGTGSLAGIALVGLGGGVGVTVARRWRTRRAAAVLVE
ncbi:hypothetical protein SAMN05428957_103347 [Oryzisolibacter propanilivorax]|uniref:Uncharacterized protein n=1 Tax=Oryzisolibacter propanilivorax TaxID=1527607 RepID=A0A1G9RNL7_9BURK|nr:hypothetical protein [Oryzisolibacter propanilivorax]SDM23985.1 hypothetical protein SAMN05428957_103347 [Oryzisolibacter propanilivorax]